MAKKNFLMSGELLNMPCILCICSKVVKEVGEGISGTHFRCQNTVDCEQPISDVVCTVRIRVRKWKRGKSGRYNIDTFGRLPCLQTAAATSQMAHHYPTSSDLLGYRKCSSCSIFLRGSEACRRPFMPQSTTQQIYNAAVIPQ